MKTWAMTAALVTRLHRKPSQMAAPKMAGSEMKYLNMSSRLPMKRATPTPPSRVTPMAARVEGEGQEARQGPEDHDDPLEEHASDHADTGGHLVLGRTGGLHARGHGADGDEIGPDHGPDGVPGELAQCR